MRAISNNETARKRTAVTPKRSETAVVKRPTLVSDSAGGSTTSWTTIGTYSCRIASGTPWNFPAELLTASQIKATSIWTVGLPHTVTIGQEDIIEINGERFEVFGQWGPKRPRTEYKVIVLRVE